jgi:hypothetical protein
MAELLIFPLPQINQKMLFADFQCIKHINPGAYVRRSVGILDLREIMTVKEQYYDDW